MITMETMKVTIHTLIRLLVHYCDSQLVGISNITVTCIQNIELTAAWFTIKEAKILHVNSYCFFSGFNLIMWTSRVSSRCLFLNSWIQSYQPCFFRYKQQVQRRLRSTSVFLPCFTELRNSVLFICWCWQIIFFLIFLPQLWQFIDCIDWYDTVLKNTISESLQEISNLMRHSLFFTYKFFVKSWRLIHYQ